MSEVLDRIAWVIAGWSLQLTCLLRGHAYVDREEHGWPRTRICTRCGDIADPDPNPGAGPPDEYRPRTRERARRVHHPS